MLPLGTGNDLARTLNWAQSRGFGLEGGNFTRKVTGFIRDCEKASVALLDRWSVQIADSSRYGAPGATGSGMMKSMINYYSIGVDAKVALSFHTLREEHPEWFQSQVGNKLWYTGVGAPEALLHSCQNLAKKIRVECDGVPVQLPPDIEGVLVLNIGSYMGGVVMWGSNFEDGFEGQAFNDGLLEVVGINGTWHLGKLQAGVSKGAHRIAQGSSISITSQCELPMQIDGEPWSQHPTTIQISAKDQVLMLRKENEKEGHIMSCVLEALDHCEGNQTITADQYKYLIREIAARLHRPA